MADKKISELTNITGANLADTDEFVVVDASANETKAVTRAEMFKNTPSVGIGTSSLGSKLSIVGLPTSSAGLSAGDVWNDGGTLVII